MSINVALIGCGNISKYHLEGITTYGTLRYACDIDKEAALQIASLTQAQAITDYKEALDDPLIDVVHVVTHSKFHKEICIAALNAAKHVICEKTLGENPDESLAIVESAKNTKNILFTSYMKRYIPSVQQAKKLIPEIGRVLSARFFTRQMWGDLWNGNPQDPFFRVGKEGVSEVVRRFGGGILHCGGSHILDLILFLFGRPDSLIATQIRPSYLDYDLKTEATLYKDELAISFEALAHPLQFSGFLKDGWDEGFEIIGSKGRLLWKSSLWDDVTSKSSRLVYESDKGESREYDYHPVSPFTKAIEAFYHDIESNKQSVQNVESGYEVDVLIETITKSAKKKSKEVLQW